MNMKNKPCYLLAFNNKLHLLKSFIQGIFDRYPGCDMTLVLSYNLREKEIINDEKIKEIITYRNFSVYRVVRIIERIQFILQFRKKKYAVLIIPERNIRFQLLSFLISADERYAYDVDHREWNSCTINGVLKLILKRISGLLIIGPISYLYMFIIVSAWGVARFFSCLVKKALKKQNA